MSALSVPDHSWISRTIGRVSTPDADTTITVLGGDAARKAPKGADIILDKAPGAVGSSRSITLRATRNGKTRDKVVPINTVREWPKPLVARFNALDLSKLWQDDAGTVPVTADGQPIGRIGDAVRGALATQSTAGARPTYRTNVQNGRPGIYFDGVNDFLNVLDAALLGFLNAGHNAKKYTIVPVIKVDQLGGPQTLISWGTSAGQVLTIDTTSANLIGTNVGLGLSTAVGSDANSMTSLSLGQATILSTFSDGARVEPNIGFMQDGLYGYVNSNGNSFFEVPADRSTGPVAPTSLFFGKRAGDNTPYHFKGYLLDLLIFDGNIGARTLQYVHKWLGAEWGITTTFTAENTPTDPSAYEVWRSDDFDTYNVTPLGTDKAPTGWLPAYISPGAGARDMLGSGGAIGDEQQLFGDIRNPAIPSSIVEAADSKLKFKPIPTPDGLKNTIAFAVSGTVTTTSGSATVTGVGTKFNAELSINSLLHDNQGRFLGEVGSIQSDTQLTLLTNAAQVVSGASVKRVGMMVGFGTLAYTAGSKAVTGTNTGFVQQMPAGTVIYLQDGTILGTVASVANNNALTLVDNAATTGSGLRFAKALPYLSYAHISVGHMNRAYGRIDIRCKMGGPISGSFPALWLMPLDFVWPGEGDIHEDFGWHSGSVRYVSEHTDPYRPIAAGAAGKTQVNTKLVTDPLDEEFHDIGIEWDETGMYGTLDGYRIGRVPNVNGARAATIANAGSGAPNGTRSLLLKGGTSDGAISVVSAGGVATSVTVTRSGAGFTGAPTITEANGAAVLYGQAFTVDVGPDTGLPSQFHQPFYLLMDLALGSIGGPGIAGDPLPTIEIDDVRWFKPKRPVPAKLTVGNTPAFDTTASNAANAIISAHASKGTPLTSAEQAAVLYIVRQMMAWELRNDVRETNMPALWDNTKRSLWDARDALYIPAIARSRAGSRINWKNPATELSENGTGIGWTQGRGLSLPGTATAYLSGGPAITDTQFNQYDNGFELFLTQAPTNTDVATAIAFDANHRFDIAAGSFDPRLSVASVNVSHLTRDRAMGKGLYAAARGHRPSMHVFKDGEAIWGGYTAGDSVATRTGSLKIGSRDGATAGAAFEFAFASAGRRVMQEEAERMTTILAEAFALAGIVI